MLEAVFERFWQVGKNDQRGLGLGLYISKCIVDAHGGKIWAESKLGEGSAFHFTIRRAPDPRVISGRARGRCRSRGSGRSRQGPALEIVREFCKLHPVPGSDTGLQPCVALLHPLFRRRRERAWFVQASTAAG